MDAMKPPPPEELAEIVAFEGSAHNDEKPQTAEELFRVLQEDGFFGAWKDRTDIGDTLEYARKLRERASTRTHE